MIYNMVNAIKLRQKGGKIGRSSRSVYKQVRSYALTKSNVLLPSNLPNFSNVLQVFRDETGTKRQQWLYPAPKGRFLANLFQNMPGTQSVSLNNDGTILVAQENSKKIHGLLGYQWKAGGTPTGSMQFAQSSDMNGDGLSDYLITYENGETQVMYRLP